ncbi:MAG: YhgE/Pip domain-containing protein [Gordonia sp. (in: high G+C Gram-positive bacteria)]
MLAVFSPGSDFKRYLHGRMPRMAVLAVILMPLLYSALYLWAYWNPFNEVAKVPVAIVNLDAGAEIQGAKLDAGKQVVDGLVDSKALGLHVVSAVEAADGVAHGKYYFSITLPKDFSASVASLSSKNPHSAKLIFTYNDTNNYLSTIIGQNAAQQVVRQVSAQIGQNLFDVVFENVDPMIGKINEAADGAGQLAAGLKEAKSGANDLNDGMQQLDDGAHQLNDGMQQLAAAVLKATAPLMPLLQATGDMSPAQLAATAQRLGTNVETLNKYLDEAANAQSQAYNLLVGAMNQLRASPDPNVRAAAALLEPVKSLLATRGLGPQANNQLSSVHDDAQKLSAQMSDPNSPLRKGLALLQSGDLAGQLQVMRGAVTQLADGSSQLADGTTQLTAGTGALNTGLGQLSDGADELASGLDAGAKAIPHWTAEQQKKLAATLAQPVGLDEVHEHQAETFGDGFAPFFISLALFIGGMLAWMIFTPIQPRPVAQGLHPLRVVLASYIPTFFVGVLQATILYVVVVFALGLNVVYPFAAYGFLLLVIAMFLAMVQMFNAVLGAGVGRVTTLAFLMIMLTSAGGIYPVETTAKPFQWIHPFDPMTYTVNGLRQLTLGGVDSRLPIAIAVIVGLTVVFIAVSALAARRNQQYTMDRLYPPVEV